MIREAFEAYRDVVRPTLLNVQLLKPHPVLEQAVEKVQSSIGTPNEVSVVQLVVPELLEGETVNTYQCRVYVVAPNADRLVEIVDELLEKLKIAQGPIHNRYRPRTQNLEGLAYLVTAVFFQLKL
jgi:hypothetical protein